jgi:exodeoxyribonuclease VII small subunit
MKKPKEIEEPKPESFDEQLERLRALVETLERGGLTLDDSLKIFEQGIGLSRNLFQTLNEAEGKVEELLATLERIPFGKGEE